MITREMLMEQLKNCQSALLVAKQQLDQFDSLAENNVFATMEEAEGEMEDILRRRAYDDCEGAYNCGDREYRQEFMVGDKKYVAISEFQYNRHDKTYYYIEEEDFRIEEL